MDMLSASSDQDVSKNIKFYPDQSTTLHVNDSKSYQKDKVI